MSAKTKPIRLHTDTYERLRALGAEGYESELATPNQVVAMLLDAFEVTDDKLVGAVFGAWLGFKVSSETENNLLATLQGADEDELDDLVGSIVRELGCDEEEHEAACEKVEGAILAEQRVFDSLEAVIVCARESLGLTTAEVSKRVYVQSVS